MLACALATLAACGSSSSSNSQTSGPLSGNWQFTLTNTPDLSASSGLQGGFLLDNNGSVSGQVLYFDSLLNAQGECNSGAGSVTGTVSGQTVNLTVNAGGQIYTLTGALSSNGSSISAGTYTVTPGPNAPGTSTPCGAGTASGTTLPWSATSVPALTGSVTGTLHSNSQLLNQDFPVTGTLTQGPNTGANSATVTGTLDFLNPTTGLSDYPCIPSGYISVNGQISGNLVVLNLIDVGGQGTVGHIGVSPSSAVNGFEPVTLQAAQPSGAYVLQSTGLAYVVATPSCPSTGATNQEDTGYLCLALNNSSACQEPLTLTPAFLTFSPQLLGSTAPTQTITITDDQASGSSPLTLQLAFQLATDPNYNGYSDFNQLPNYTATDNCVSDEVLPPDGEGAQFTLSPGGSCTVTVTFSPQEECPWVGTAPVTCPAALGANIVVHSSASADGDKLFSVPISGTGLSFVQPSLAELDFSAEAVGESSQPQLLTFTNNASTPVQILGAQPCANPPGTPVFVLPNDPVTSSSPVAGLAVAVNGSGFPQTLSPYNQTTVSYNCDLDPQSHVPNFQITDDSCTGALLAAQASCSVEVAYAPQPSTDINAGLDFFLEFNTVQCWPPSPATPPPDCEIDSGRFPVELKTNAPGPLRLLPAAGLSFGAITVGKSSAAQTVTVINDPLPNATAIDFQGKIVVNGNYSETDDCPFSLAPGASCTLTVVFKPKATGYNGGTLTINYTGGTSGNLPQLVFLHGTGQ